MILIYCDNMSSIQLAKIPVFHARTTHVEVHYHFVHERVLSGEAELRYVQMDQQVASIFMKLLSSDKLQHFARMLGLQHVDVPHMRGRTGKGKEIGNGTGQGTGEEKAKIGGDKRRKEAKSTEEIDTSE